MIGCEHKMFCKECGSEINDKAVICPSCGVPVGNIDVLKKPGISRGWAAVASLLIVGLGQILQGRVGRGVAWLIGSIIISIATMGIAAPIMWIASAIDAYKYEAYDIT
ncbi:MAG: zinc ribbon domain-containing protein [Methanobacterium sp.]|uniref:zinc-ribbon domain-containing protein n=1 Tax=Methanobacterium sp. TaxID=2164 RepID=UPI003D661639|nr:zinc ribbon domain-containing protein [Methanobacterium sp.]